MTNCINRLPNFYMCPQLSVDNKAMQESKEYNDIYNEKLAPLVELVKEKFNFETRFDCMNLLSLICINYLSLNWQMFD